MDTIKSKYKVLITFGVSLFVLFSLSQLDISPHISYSFPIATETAFIIPTKIPSKTPTASVIPTKKPTETPAQPVYQSSAPTEKVLQKDYFLAIPKIQLYAPIIPNVSGADKNLYLDALINGVAQFSGTSHPGEGSKIFIFGHSSYYANRPGNYKRIFATLDRLNEGDEIEVWYQQELHKYRVFEKKVVSPSDLSVLDPTDEEVLTLQTCWPIPTTRQRLIINAKKM